MKQQKKKQANRPVRKAEKVENRAVKARRLRRWRLLAAFSGAVIVICLILLYFMGEL